MTVRLELRWRGGSYCARVLGPDPKFHLEREFENGQTLKVNKGTLRFELTPGYYETQEWEHGRGKVRTYWRVDELLARPVFDSEALVHFADAAGGPLPGEPGEWGSDRCKCGADAFDDQGWPHCAEHTPVVMVDTSPAESPPACRSRRWNA